MENKFKYNLSVRTTYHEFNNYFLEALENDNLPDFKDALNLLVVAYPYHMMAWRFLAQTYRFLGDDKKAVEAYFAVLKEFDVKKAGPSSIKTLNDIVMFAETQQEEKLSNNAKKYLSQLKGFGEFIPKTYGDRSHNNLLNNDKDELLKQGKQLFDKGDFTRSVKKFQEYEKRYGFDDINLSIWLINSARAYRDDDIIIEYAEKGLKFQNKTIKQHESLLLMSIPAFRHKEKWESMRKYIANYLENTQKPTKFILRSNIECNLKLSDYDGSTSALNTFLAIYPNEKNVIKMKEDIEQLYADPSEKVEPDPSEMLEPDPSDILETDPSEMLEPDPSDILEPDPSEMLEPDPSDILEPDPSAILKLDLSQGIPDEKLRKKPDLYFIAKELGISVELKQQLPPDTSIFSDSIRNEISQYLNTLKKREREVIKMHFGIDREYALTLHEISKELNLTRERVRQIKVKAIHRLRHRVRSKTLREYLEVENIDLTDELDQDFEIEIKQSRAYKISPMLLADVQDHKFQDPTIIEQGNQPTVDDASRLLKDADKKLLSLIENAKNSQKKPIMFPLYGWYLEAAKAYSELSTDEYNEDLYQRALGRYASLRSGGFFDEFKKEVLKTNSSLEKVQKLKDSASSYYFEALRLKLDTEKKEMNPGFEIAEEVVLNFLKLNSIFFYFNNGVSIRKDHFKDDYFQTAKELLNNNGEKVLAETLLNIGAANPENFTSIFSTRETKGKLLKGHPFYVLIQNKSIFNRIGQLVGIEFKSSQINNSLKSFFDELSTTRYNKIEKQFLNIKEFSFNQKDIQLLQNELNPILNDPDKLIYTQTDISTLVKMNEIISIYEPYLKSTPEKRTAIISHLKKELISVRNSIDGHPTYWGRVQFKPIIKEWLKSIIKQEAMKSQHLQPKLRIILDPESIILTDDGGELTIGVENTGAAGATEIKCQLKLSLDKKEKINETVDLSIVELKPGMKDSYTFEFDPKSLQLLKDRHFECEIRVTGKYIGTDIKSNENYTINIQTATPIELGDIPWNETSKVPENMFKGRDDLIRQLTRHYLSNDRIETWILYGLTRHGKSSIHQYLSKALLESDLVQTNQHGTLKVLPFNWDFGVAATSVDAKELWGYLVFEQIIDKIQEYANEGIISSKILSDPVLQRLTDKNEKDFGFRAVDLRKTLHLLVKYNYLAFIAVDEFTYYTNMIDNGMITPAFLASLRKITIEDELACFIFAGVYDLIEIIKNEDYGITSQLANAREYKVAGINKKASEELIQAMGEKLQFTDEAVKMIQSITDNIPYFVQIICRRCGKYAVSKKKNVMGVSDVEKVIKFMTGEKEDIETDIAYKIKRLEPDVFKSTQFRPSELYCNAIISTIACRSIDDEYTIRQVAVDIAHEDIVHTWGRHRWSDETKKPMLGLFQGKLQESIETLEKRGVISKTSGEIETFYRLSVDLFRRWWNVEYPKLENELDKLILE